MFRAKVLEALAIAQVAIGQDVDYARFVNPFIGTEGAIPGYAYGGGDVFVGGAVPFGMVKLGIDSYEEPINQSALNGGYTPRGHVTGISLMHQSGTGGGSKYGYPSQMPLTQIDGDVNLLDNRTYWQDRVGEDVAKVGYFRTEFESGVTVELSASRHAGLYHYTYPSSSEKHVLVDLSHYLPHPTRSWDSQFYTGGDVEIQPNSSVYTGYTSIAGGWNIGAPVTVYVCGEFDSAPDEGRTFKGRNTFPPTFTGNTAHSGPMNDRVGAVFTWSNVTEIKSRVGISFMSVEKACAYKNSELSTWSIDYTAKAARDEWNRDVFSKIRVDASESANETRLALLYSSLYFMHLIPSERVGENPLWESDEPSWDDFYTMWDLFRNQVSLWHLIQPGYYESMIRSLIDIFKNDGYLPDGRSGNYNGLVQGGSNADNVLADAYVKGLTGKINWTEGYAAVKKDADVLPFFDQNPVDPQGSLKEGRSALDDWIPLGYVTADRNTRSVSKTVEYSLNDFAVSQIAAGEAPGDRDLYLRRSAGWQLSWDPEASSRNFTGFIMPRYANGTFDKTYDITDCGDCNWEDKSYEGTAFEYSFVIPHDIDRLITLMGGPSHFETRLDYVFQPNTSGVDLGVNGLGITTINNIANEPDFETPYLYNYLNKQWKSVERSRQLANDFYFNTTNGIPGNSDAGALNCWLVWQMLGLYPIVTTPVYLLESPWFSDINITVNRDKTLRIRAEGLDDGDGKQGYYVQSVSINGQEWDRNWFEHEDAGGIMTEGGEIVFRLGDEQSAWETGEAPPSPGHQIRADVHSKRTKDGGHQDVREMWTWGSEADWTHRVRAGNAPEVLAKGYLRGNEPAPPAFPASPPPGLPPAYAVVDEKATTFTIYGTFIHTPNAPAYQLSSLLDARINKLQIRRLRAEEVTRLQAGAPNVAFDSRRVLYEAQDPPFLINEYYIQGKATSTLPGVLQMRFGLRRWHIAHVPSHGERPIEIMTCGKSGGFTKAIKQRKNELEPSVWKDSEGHVLATEVLKMGVGGKMPTIELRGDLDQTCRELILALWVSRLWAAFGAGSGYMT
ncbi:glycoside hydrolase family 92 protein [Stemphylium lycopersici]|nr:glycoside hydrolase family 92 protein [Stemphylium lycopersici]